MIDNDGRNDTYVETLDGAEEHPQSRRDGEAGTTNDNCLQRILNRSRSELFEEGRKRKVTVVQQASTKKLKSTEKDGSSDLSLSGPSDDDNIQRPDNCDEESSLDSDSDDKHSGGIHEGSDTGEVDQIVGVDNDNSNDVADDDDDDDDDSSDELDVVRKKVIDVLPMCKQIGGWHCMPEYVRFLYSVAR